MPDGRSSAALRRRRTAESNAHALKLSETACIPYDAVKLQGISSLCSEAMAWVLNGRTALVLCYKVNGHV